MQIDEPRARIGYRGSSASRAKHLALKVLVALGGVVMLASAFVISLVFVAFVLAFVLAIGGYLWWQTRELRRQMRARMQEQPQSVGEVIEGEVIEGEAIEVETISREETRR
jgi:predicted PurR-regulated permease PerM